MSKTINMMLVIAKEKYFRQIKNMNNIYQILLTFIAAAFLSACSTPYYGYTKEGWYNLTKEERTVIQEEYRSIIAIKNNQSYADKIDTRKQSIIDYGIEKQEL